MTERPTRRDFSASVAAATSAALVAATAHAATPASSKDEVRLGLIGVGNRGGQLLDAVLANPDGRVVAICDVFQPHLDKTLATLAEQRPKDRIEVTKDFRKLIERTDLDAVVIATPDHWHAIQTIAACRSGKDVYVEKPLSITIHEGRKMVEVARETNRIVQVGTHRRSSDLWAKFAEMTRGGTFGKATVSRAYRLSNMWPEGIGKVAPEAPPKDLDWDMWLGPRPKRPYQANIAPYKFRWWQQYSSQMGNWGVHYLDAMRWCLDEVAPTSVCAMGGRFAVDDDRTIPDTAEAIFQFPSGHLSLFSTFEASGYPALAGFEMEMRGTLGAAYIGGSKIEVFPERGGQFQSPGPRMKPIQVAGEQTTRDLDAAHMRNFLDCVKSRQTPHADVEVGHRSTTMSLLANISLAVGQRLEWDPVREVVTNVPAANELLHYEYRKPWTLDG